MHTVTLGRKDIGYFTGRIPSEVIQHTGKEGHYTIGVTDEMMRPLGLAQFCIETGEKGFSEAGLYYIFVEEDVQRRGVGKTLLSGVISVLRKSGIKRLFAFPGNNEELKAFYRATGFQETGSSFLWKGRRVLHCWMRRTE